MLCEKSVCSIYWTVKMRTRQCGANMTMRTEVDTCSFTVELGTHAPRLILLDKSTHVALTWHMTAAADDACTWPNISCCDVRFPCVFPPYLVVSYMLCWAASSTFIWPLITMCFTRIQWNSCRLTLSNEKPLWKPRKTVTTWEEPEDLSETVSDRDFVIQWGLLDANQENIWPS